jgi:excisionase family DNA binding protein
MAQSTAIGPNEAQPTEEEFLTVAEVAARLKLTRQTIRNWIDRGELPAVRVGRRRVRVRRSDLDQFIEAGSTLEPEPDEPPATEASEPPEPNASEARAAITPEPPESPGTPLDVPPVDPMMAQARERIAAAFGAALAVESGHTPAELAAALRTLAAAAQELAAELEANPELHEAAKQIGDAAQQAVQQATYSA